MTNILEYIDELMDSGLSEEDASRCANVMYGDDGWTDDEDIPEEDIPELCEPEDDEIPSWAKSPDDDMTQDEVLKA